MVVLSGRASVSVEHRVSLQQRRTFFAGYSGTCVPRTLWSRWPQLSRPQHLPRERRSCVDMPLPFSKNGRAGQCSDMRTLRTSTEGTRGPLSSGLSTPWKLATYVSSTVCMPACTSKVRERFHFKVPVRATDRSEPTPVHLFDVLW